MVSHIENAMSSDGLPTEVLRLNFTKLQRTYTARDKTGRSTAPDTVGYDQALATMM